MALLNKLLAISVGVASLTVVMGSEAQAAQINESTWYSFRFGSAGSTAAGCTVQTCLPDAGGISEFAPRTPWEFVVDAGGAFLTIQDAFRSGDKFSAYSGGTLLGTTSSVGTGDGCGDNLLACISDPRMGRGKFFLAEGSYKFTFTADTSPFGGGVAYFRVDSAAVPEPTTILGTLAFGSLGGGAWLKRKRKSNKQA
jgi:hypothetical protein